MTESLINKSEQGRKSNLRNFRSEHVDARLYRNNLKNRFLTEAKALAIQRTKRQAFGISQEELAFRSGLHRTYVGSVERGERNLSLENIFIFAKTLGCHPRELLPGLPIKKRK